MEPFAYRATHASFWSALEIAARYGVQFVVMVVLARLLQPADFGLMAMLMVFIAFAALLTEGGLSSALVQKQKTTSDEEASVFLVNLVVGCMLAFALWMLATSVASFYREPMLVPLLHLSVWVLPLGAMAAVPNAILTQQLDFRTRAMAEFVASLLSGVLALWLAWRGHGVWSLAWQALVGAGLRAMLLWVLSGWRPRGRFDGRAFLGLLRFGGFLLLANVLNLVSVSLQSLLIGRLFDARTLGFYTLAKDTQQAPAQFMTSLLNRVGLPLFSTVAGDSAKLEEALRLSLRLSMFVFVPIMVAVAVVAEPLVMVLYGPTWGPSAPLLSVLALAAALWPLHVLNLAAISARGRSDLVLKLEIIKALISFPLIFFACFFGVQAIAWAVLVSSLVCAGINTRHSYLVLGCGLRAQLDEIRPTLLLTLLAAGSAWLALGMTTKYPVALALSAAVVIVVYVGGAVIFRLQAWRSLIDSLRLLRSYHRHVS